MQVKDWFIRYKLPTLIGILFLASILFVSYNFLFQARKANDELISDHIAKLNDIFNSINKSAKINGFKSKKNAIDFLNVKDFSGNILGSIILAEPKNWAGPYLNENLTMDGKEYQIIRAQRGYYIAPGDGVVLSNGLIMGKTVNIDKNTDLDKLISDPNYFYLSARPLIAFLEMSQSPEVDKLIAKHISQLKEIFIKINSECKINAFRNQWDFVDFLNVKSFAGNVIGSMNLVSPEKWQGPYLEQNLSINNNFYQIVKNSKGYYVIPPNGVELYNGKIIGKTLIITNNSDLDQLMLDKNALASEYGALAFKIPTVQNPFEALDKTDFLKEESEVTY